MSTARSPGKVILSGEHAILAGCPALVMATSPRVTCDSRPSACGAVHLTLPGRPEVTVPSSDLPGRAAELTQRHTQGLPPRLPEDVLLTALARTAPDWQGHIVFSTSLPIGSGLGASAAFLLSLFKSLHPQLSDRDLYSSALDIEHLQHGTSSGVDVWTSLHGGLWWLHREERIRLAPTTLPGFRLLHSGTPASTTGECVQQVKRHFPADHPVWTEFDHVIHQTREAVEQNRPDHWSEAIRHNHRLLTRIGVVPEAVQEAVRKIEAEGGCAKICGAGSVRGDSAGILLVRDADPESLPQHWSDIQAGFCQTGTSA